MSKQGVAPCGHPGTYVTNTFISCNLRCGLNDAKPVAPPSARREPGHVDMCACAPCQIRRRSVSIVLTSKDGVKIQLPWNGVTNKVSWTPNRACSVRHWSFVDASGDEVVAGHTAMELIGGRTASVNIELFMDAVVKAMLTIEQPHFKITWQPLNASAAMRHHERIERPMSVDQIYSDMKSMIEKAPSSLEVAPGGLFDAILKITAERTAALYELLEQTLSSLPQM